MIADLPWFEDLLRAVASRDAALGPFTASLWEGGVRLDVVADGAPLRLDLHPRREGDAYARTASFTLYLRHGGPLRAASEEVLRRLIGALSAADPGGLTLPKGEAVPEELVPEAVRTGGRSKSGPYVDPLLDWLTVAHGLPDALRCAACLAWHADRSGQDYPFEAALGPQDDPHADVRAWVLARWPAGFGRQELASGPGVEAADALMAVLEPLRRIGVCEVGDHGVAFFPGVGGDVAVHAVLLWAPAVRLAAEAAWGGACDGGERARLDAIAGWS